MSKIQTRLEALRDEQPLHFRKLELKRADTPRPAPKPIKNSPQLNVHPPKPPPIKDQTPPNAGQRLIRKLTIAKRQRTASDITLVEKEPKKEPKKPETKPKLFEKLVKLFKKSSVQQLVQFDKYLDEALPRDFDASLFRRESLDKIFAMTDTDKNDEWHEELEYYFWNIYWLALITSWFQVFWVETCRFGFRLVVFTVTDRGDSCLYAKYDNNDPANAPFMKLDIYGKSRHPRMNRKSLIIALWILLTNV